jgi:flagellar motor protein MotB
MSRGNIQSTVRLEAKRQTELWIYSFADMYMILAVFFIAIAVIYAARAKHAVTTPAVPSAGRGLAALTAVVSIEFPSGSDTLGEKSIQDLQLLMPVMRSSKGMVDIEGYADGAPLGSGSDFSSNLHLSNARAVRVAEYLIKNGISARRVRTFSYGDGRQYRTGPDGIQTNRRVVLKVLPAEGG